MDHAEITIIFEKDMLQDLVWIVVNGKRIGAVPPEQLIKICNSGIGTAHTTRMNHIMLSVLKKEEPIEHEAQFIPADDMPMPGSPGVIMAQHEDGIKYHAGFWQGNIFERQFGTCLRVKTLDDMGKVLHDWLEDYGKLKDDQRQEAWFQVDIAESLISGDVQ